MPEPPRPSSAPSRWAAWLLLLGLYLTARGYHSRDGDQAYRLPLLLDRQDPSLYAADPFVRAFDVFNPHRGYLTLLDLSSRPVGLSAALAGLFALTFVLTCAGIDRLARAAWPESGPGVGLVAVGLVLLAKAGNVGTNHLFEAMLLDRLIGFALGWLAFAAAIARPGGGNNRTAPLALGLATCVHPSVGLQLGMLLATAWVAWSVRPGATGVTVREAVGNVARLGLALVPGVAIQAGQGRVLMRGLPAEEFRLLSAFVQSPQHMLPHLWRMPQWLAWAAYFVLAALALGRVGSPDGGGGRPPARRRLAILLGVNLLALALAWVGVEVVGDLRLTLFQPFRLATVARGLALVLVADRAWRLGTRGDREGRARAVLLAVGVTGDWTLVVVTVTEGVTSLVETLTKRPLARPLGLAVLVAGLGFLARHDTESGHIRLLLTLSGFAVWELLAGGRLPRPTSRRVAWAIIIAWALPLAALAAPLVPGADTPAGRRVVEALARRWRFAEVPADDLERLALWCRAHTPTGATFVGPPGPKTFRLWSRRCIAFNRAGSPYHAAGLADWAARFRDHVGFRGPTAAFARAYLADRHGLERRYAEMTDAEKAALALRQGAGYVLAPRPGRERAPGADRGPLRLLHVEGRWAVYRVRDAAPAQAKAGAEASAGTG